MGSDINTSTNYTIVVKALLRLAPKPVVKEPTCDGKIVEIDGKKYKLTEVK